MVSRGESTGQIGAFQMEILAQRRNDFGGQSLKLFRLHESLANR